MRDEVAYLAPLGGPGYDRVISMTLCSHPTLGSEPFLEHAEARQRQDERAVRQGLEHAGLY